MATKRKTISKKTRFEVFKRDGFKCQYCGAMAPDVLLELDHIQPVSKDGDDDVLNYITACKPCNSGKGDRLLSDSSAVKLQQAQLAELQQRREQIEMMLSWRDGLKGIETDQVEVIADAWRCACKGWHLNEKGLKTAKALLKRHGLQRVLDAIETAEERYLVIDADGVPTSDSVDLAWRKVGGICTLAGLPEDVRQLHYVKGILRNRMHYVPDDVVRILNEALERGVTVDDMLSQAKTCRNWSDFSSWLYKG